MTTKRDATPTRASYPHFTPLETRWMDNDVYGHVNNVVYYSFFDTVINRYLIHEGGLDIHGGRVIGLAVETQCAFASSVQFPDVLAGGLRVAQLGNSSVRYEVGIFRAEQVAASAFGRFTHVFVDRTTRRPVPIEGQLRDALARLLVQ